MTRDKIRVLLLAEAANPEWASVPLVGWSHSRAIASLTPAHLVTQVRNRQSLLRAGLVEGSDFTAVDSELIAKPLSRISLLLRGGPGQGWTTAVVFSTISYYFFEHLVWKLFEEDLRRGRYDLVHRLTPLSPAMPSLMATRCRRIGVPFVLGPINGGVPWPKGFDSTRRREREWLSPVRAAYKLLPGYRSTLRDASAIIVGSRVTWNEIPRVHRAKCYYIPENAIDSVRFPSWRNRRASRPIKAIFVGRLVPLKGVDMLIEAAAPLLREGAMTLNIIGDGPQMAHIREFLRMERVEAAVRLAGWVDHEQVQKELTEADLFVFPSIREFGGGAVLEAMAAGVMPVVLDYAGPAELVTKHTGCLIELTTRREIVARLREALSQLAANPDEIDRKGLAAMHRARGLFTWEVKAKQVLKIYRWVLGMESDRPVYPMPVPDVE